MFVLIKNAYVYSPYDMGKQEILIANEKVAKIDKKINFAYDDVKIIDAKGKKIIPGFIDKHIHITGGGGEAGFKSKVFEVGLNTLIRAGITSVVGLLGTDSISRSVENLLAKTKGLKEQGINAYCLSGAYEYPSPTLTGSIKKDIAFIDEIIGTKIAISDHRDSAISVDELSRLVLDTRVGGMIGGKKSFVTIHMGDFTQCLDKIYECMEKNYINIKLFQPTHIGRNEKLFYEGLKFNQKGGYIDISADGNFDDICQLFKILKSKNANFDLITISSDGNGSWSEYDENGALVKIGAARCDLVYQKLKELIKTSTLSFEDALKLGTLNVAKSIGINAGEIKQGLNADLVMLDENLDIDMVMVKGKVFLEDKELLVKGMFE